MGHGQEKQLARLSSKSSLQCSFCRKEFAKESTQKRHYYYCRSKLSLPQTSRRRACSACIRAKTRCTWDTHTGFVTCARCNKRGLKCEHDIVARGDAALEHDESDITPNPDNAQGSESHGHTASPAFNGAFDFTDVSQGAKSTNIEQNTEVVSANLPSGDWEVDLDQPESFELDNEFVGSWNFSSIFNPFNSASDTSKANRPSIIPWSLQSFGTASFDNRTFTDPTQAAIATLLMQTLRSYAFKILRKENLPPFVSSVLLSCVEKGEHVSQQSLINCVSLVHMFKLRTAANKSFTWKLIRIEQERILAEYSDFDRWELLGALQALLVYCLLRLLDSPLGNDSFDVPLLVTVRLVTSSLALSVGGDHVLNLPDDPKLEWGDWIFNESRRRTIVIFVVIHMLVDISTAIHCQPMAGFIIVPLVSNVAIWNAKNAEQWRSEFRLSGEERVIYGLSVSGELVALRQNEAGIQSSITEWEEWVAGTGEIGNLIMIAGGLVRARGPQWRLYA